MKIVFAGTPSLAIPGLLEVQAAGHEIVGVITREDAPVGRKKVLTPSPVAARAQELGIPLLKKNRLDETDVEWVHDTGADLGVVIAYGGLLKKDMLRTPKLGWINLHFSELPRWRGAAPVQRALMANEKEIGVSVFRLVEELDAGDILTTKSWEFEEGTSAGEVLDFLAKAGSKTLVEAVQILAENPESGSAQVGERSYAHKLTREDGKLDFTKTRSEIVARWAGVTPQPGAWALTDEQPIKIQQLKTYNALEQLDLVPGEVALINKKVVVGTIDKPIELIRVQPAGKQQMDAAAWIRGKNGKATLA